MTKIILKSLFFLVLACASAWTQTEPPTPYHLSPEKLDSELGVSAGTKFPAEFIRVIYFHRTPGCATCQKMAKMTFQIIREDFSSEASARKIMLRYYDFEAPESSSLVRAFHVQSPSLFLVKFQNGKMVKAVKLPRIWELSGKKDDFREYVVSAIRKELK